MAIRSPFGGRYEFVTLQGGNGLPRQSADWLAMTGKPGRCPPTCHCEERSDVAIRSPFGGRYEIATLQGETDCRASVRTGSQ